jgi:hypothetical protein
MEMMNPSNSNLQIFNWQGVGYQPLVFSHDWQVAILNWEPVFDLDNAGEIERHNLTDEVFILWRGRGALFVAEPAGLRIEDMQPGVLYNVPRGVWHNLLATPDASWIIVENRDTHLHDTEIRKLTSDELAQLKENRPPWLK